MLKSVVLYVSLFLCSCWCKNLVLKNDKLEKCQTPDLKEGKCILLENCPILLNNANDLEKPMTLKRLNFLIASQCGFKGNLPKVCCPLEEIKKRHRDCMTPDYKDGKCIMLEDCPKILSDSIDFETPMTLERLNFLIGSQCGFNGSYPKVCCNLNDLK